MSSPPPELILDVVLVPVGLAVLLLYNVVLYLRVQQNPMKTVIGVNHLNRRAWVYSIMKDVDKKSILAVQTLRNHIMASTLLATTAIILSSGIAAFITSAATADVKASVFAVTLGSREPAVVAVKFISIFLCFLFAFVCHVQSIRYTNHVNFLINIPMGPQAQGLSPDYVAAVLARGSNFYTIGTRALYCAFPLLLWLFGPIPMLLSSLLLVVMLYHFDTARGFMISLESPGENGVEEGSVGGSRRGGGGGELGRRRSGEGDRGGLVGTGLDDVEAGEVGQGGGGVGGSERLAGTMAGRGSERSSRVTDEGEAGGLAQRNGGTGLSKREESGGVDVRLILE
ncbi:hypothetical protein CLOM_g22134 [Closterium sp. NIES-68]|nr:hypothetical protein CLOM_g22134 [Closterium sp. NIES-68]GJP74485.1 hypothetical protein CLOP_g5058 [Closterium sp. NIES-67]